MNATLLGVAVALGMVTILLAAMGQSTRATANEPVSIVTTDGRFAVLRYPSPDAPVQATYPRGTVLQATGRCVPMASRPDAMPSTPPRDGWCQVWHAPRRDGVHVAGWVRSVTGPGKADQSFSKSSAVPFMQ